MINVDSETLFNGAAAFVATLALGIFILSVDLGYSPITKYGLVVAFLAGIFTLTQRSDDQQLVFFGYGVIIIGSITLFLQVVGTLGAGNALIVLGLLLIAAILFVLRTQLNGIINLSPVEQQLSGWRSSRSWPSPYSPLMWAPGDPRTTSTSKVRRQCRDPIPVSSK